MIEFLGNSKGIRLQKRNTNDNHISIILLTKEGDNWSDSDDFSSCWIDEIIKVLQEAEKYIKTLYDSNYDGVFAVEFKGKCIGVRVNRNMATLLTEDDDRWCDDEGEFHVSLLGELVKKLCDARNYIITQEPDIASNGRQYGYKFSNDAIA